jgi:hypothetical protein
MNAYYLDFLLDRSKEFSFMEASKDVGLKGFMFTKEEVEVSGP